MPARRCVYDEAFNMAEARCGEAAQILNAALRPIRLSLAILQALQAVARHLLKLSTTCLKFPRTGTLRIDVICLAWSWFVRFRMLVAVAVAAQLVVGSSCTVWRKPPAHRPGLVNPALDDRLQSLLSFDVPLIGADSLIKLSDIRLLDARDPEEFAVSHIAKARWIDPKKALPAWTDTIPRDAPIAVYCSVGYRSEKMGRQLREAGFTNVMNLYGSLFDWIDRGLPVVDSSGRPTDRIHTYNSRWGELVTNPSAEKVW